MHQKLAAHAGNPQIEQWNAKLEAARLEQQKQKSLFDRELFYALQPEERLTAMIARYNAAVG